MPDEQVPQEFQMQMQLPPEHEVGVFSDYASVWHTPNTFVLDFMAIKLPPHPAVDSATGLAIPGSPAIMEARVAARVRIPSEQIFPLIQALQTQGDAWLAESGRSEPPLNWVGGA
jgi:hypothetical protein